MCYPYLHNIYILTGEYDYITPTGNSLMYDSCSPSGFHDMSARSVVEDDVFCCPHHVIKNKADNFPCYIIKNKKCEVMGSPTCFLL